MAIETICTGCGQRLRVAAEHAGKKARCPSCGTIYEVPLPGVVSRPSPSAPADPLSSPYSQAPNAQAPNSQAPNAQAPNSQAPNSQAPNSQAPNLQSTYTQGPSEPQGVPHANSDPTAANVPSSGSDLWQLRTADGSVYGPVPKRELDGWVNQGRVTPDSQLLQQGNSQWILAATIYPQLQRMVTPQSAANPFADTAAGSPAYFGTAAGLEPNRAALVLTFGILSVVGILTCPVLFLFGPFAWAMGHIDIRKMREGQMDPSGLSSTQWGMYLGVAGSFFLLLCCGFFAFAIVADA